MINNTKLKTEKIDCQSYFGVMQGAVMHTLMYTYAQNSKWHTIINLIIVDGYLKPPG